MRHMAISKRLLFLFVVFVPLWAQAQRAELKPRWINSQPKSSNTSYEFKTFWVQANSMASAKQSLPREASYYMERTFGVEGVHVKLVNENISYKGDQIINDTQITVVDSVRTTNDKVDVRLRVIDEYKQGRDCYFLCAMPNPNARIVAYDSFIVTDKYGARGLWRSAIVPGWGQFHKGANLKGGLMLGGSVALAAGIVYTETMRKDYLAKIDKTKITEHKRAYHTTSENFALGRNICIGALAGLYVYNLIDAIAAPGARYVKVRRVDSRGNTYAMAPTMMTDGSPGVAATIRF